MKVRYGASDYRITGNPATSCTHLKVNPTEAQQLAISLLTEMGRQGDLIPLRKEIIPILEDIYHQT